MHCYLNFRNVNKLKIVQNIVCIKTVFCFSWKIDLWGFWNSRFKYMLISKCFRSTFYVHHLYTSKLYVVVVYCVNFKADTYGTRIMRSQCMRIKRSEWRAAVPSLVSRSSPFTQQQAQAHVQVILSSGFIASLLDVTPFVICGGDWESG